MICENRYEDFLHIITFGVNVYVVTLVPLCLCIGHPLPNFSLRLRTNLRNKYAGLKKQ